MRLRTQFISTMLLFGAVLVVMAASTIITGQQLEKAGRQEKSAADIAKGAGELGYLANDYLIYRESPQLKRWQNRFIAFSAEVASLRPDRPEQQALIVNIQANQKRLKEVFDSVASAPGSLSGNPGGAPDPAFLQVSWSRMAVQSQGLVSDASRLSDLLHRQMDRLSETRTLLMNVMVGLFGVFLLSSYMLTYRRILKSIATLRAGASVIGSGNLDFRFDEKKNDEIGDLSHAFNRMTADLKTVTASQEDLEREVAERRRAEQALRQSEQRWATTLASIGDAVIATDAESRISFLNPVAAALTGWPMEEAVGRPVLELFRIVNEKTRQPGEDIVGRVLREGGKVALANHTALVARGGREIPIEDSAAPIRDSAGKVVGVVIVFHDATEKRLAVEALRESEATFRAIGELNPFGIWECDAEGAVVYLSQSWLDMVGMTLDDCRRFGWLDRYYPGEGEKMLEAWQRCREAETRWEYEHHILDKNGLERWSLSRGFPLRDPDGRITRWVGLNIDITERKQAEVALQTAHAQLQDHARRLEETNRELEGFAYTISHDLRAPLRAINGFAHMLDDDYGPSLDAEGKRRLAVIEANAVKMGILIDDLLAFSRSGRTAMNISPIDMNGLAADVVETLKTSQPGAKADIQVTGLPPARGDAALIRQVLANLLENAVKFSSHRPDPRIEVGSLEREGEQVYFIKDNGVGFDMKYYNKLFGVFQRLVTEKEFEGTGVGLAIVHRLVTRHGGRVWAEGRPGEGATFFFTMSRKR